MGKGALGDRIPGLRREADVKMTAKRKTIGLTLALLGITVFSGQACPPNMESESPACSGNVT